MRDRCRLGSQQRAVETATHHVQLVAHPIAIRPALELAPPELADGHHEAGFSNLLRQRERMGRVELLGAVNGDAVARSPEPSAKQRHHGGVRPEVGVQVLRAPGGRPLANPTRLGPVGQMAQDPRRRASACRERGAQRAQRAARPADERAEQRRDQPQGPAPQHHARAAELVAVRGVHERGRRRAQGDPQDLYAEPFHRLDLAADEGVTQQGILVHQVHHAQRRPGAAPRRIRRRALTHALWRTSSRSVRRAKVSPSRT